MYSAAITVISNLRIKVKILQTQRSHNVDGEEEGPAQVPEIARAQPGPLSDGCHCHLSLIFYPFLNG